MRNIEEDPRSSVAEEYFLTSIQVIRSSCFMPFFFCKLCYLGSNYEHNLLKYGINFFKFVCYVQVVIELLIFIYKLNFVVILMIY